MSRLVTVLALSLALGCQTSSTKPASTASSPDSGAPAAKWNGGSITNAELDAAVYEQKKQALESMLVRKLVEQKAKEEKVTPEELVKRDITDKVKKPSEEEMRKFYDERAAPAKAAGQQVPPYEQVKEQIAQAMERPALMEAQRAYVEKLKKDLGVEVNLKPPRVEVAAEGPSKGPASAPVTIVEFSDFQCPFCVKAEETVKKVMSAYEGKIRLVYRDFPLPFHPQAQKAAEAAQCAGDQGKYWPMHEKLFANQQALEVPALKGYAKDLGLDQAKFDKCLDGNEKASVVDASRKAGEKVGVTGTPAFFINGIQLSGAQPFEEFKSIIDGELARK